MTGETDPAAWSGELGLGIAAFGIIVVGTTTSVTHLLGSGSMGIVTIAPTVNYRWACIASTVPSIIFVYGSTLQGIFNTLLVFVGLLVGPFWAVALVDYTFLRKQKIDVRSCYEPFGAYRYTHGYNLTAFTCALAGMVVWVFLGGWQTGFSLITFSAGEAAFQAVSATLPSMVVAGALYFVVARITHVRRQVGGYIQRRAVDDPQPAIAARAT